MAIWDPILDTRQFFVKRWDKLNNTDLLTKSIKNFHAKGPRSQGHTHSHLPPHQLKERHLLNSKRWQDNYLPRLPKWDSQNVLHPHHLKHLLPVKDESLRQFSFPRFPRFLSRSCRALEGTTPIKTHQSPFKNWETIILNLYLLT